MDEQLVTIVEAQDILGTKRLNLEIEKYRYPDPVRLSPSGSYLYRLADLERLVDKVAKDSRQRESINESRRLSQGRAEAKRYKNPGKLERALAAMGVATDG
jgi:hypothetical protein